MRLFLCVLAFCLLKVAEAQDATVEFHNMVYEIESTEKMTVTQHYRILIHNEEGLDFAVFRDYTDKSKRINKLECTVYDRNQQKVRKLGKDDALDVMLNNSYEITDTRTIFLEPDYQQFPFTVEFKVESTHKGFLGIPTWNPRFAFGLAIEKASLTLRHPSDYGIRVFEESGLKHLTRELGDVYELVWDVENLEAIADDQSYRDFYDDQRKVRFAPDNISYDGSTGMVSSWAEFGNWFLDLNEDRNGLTESTKLTIDSLKDSYEGVELMKRIHDYMQDRTRYVSIQLGIGGFQTIPSDVVDQTGYGDCKALTNYMKSMLSYAGIESNYILVRAGADVPDVLSEFPSNQFNHVFLGIKTSEDTIHIECTSQTVPFNYLGSFTDDRNVLWVERDRSTIIRSPFYDEVENVEKTTGIITLTKDGDATFELQTESSGKFFDQEYMAYEMLNEEQLRQYHYSSLGFNDFSIQRYEVHRPNSDKPTIVKDIHLNVKNVARNATTKMIMPNNLLQSLDEYVAVDKYKKYAEVKRPFTIEQEILIRIPEGFYPRILPEVTEKKSKYGSYYLLTERSQEGLKLKRIVVFKKGKHSSDSFADFYEYFDSVKKSDKKKILFESKT